MKDEFQISIRVTATDVGSNGFLVIPYPLEVYCGFPLRFDTYITNNKHSFILFSFIAEKRKRSWERKREWPFSSGDLVVNGEVGGHVSTEAEVERTLNLMRCGNRGFWKQSGDNTKEEEVGNEANLRICKAVPFAQLCKLISLSMHSHWHRLLLIFIPSIIIDGNSIHVNNRLLNVKPRRRFMILNFFFYKDKFKFRMREW